MSGQKRSIPAIPDPRSYLWLAVVAVLGPFTNGKWVIPLAAWLGPVFTIRFLRSQPPLRGFILCIFVVIGIIILSVKGLVPIPGIGFYVFAVITAVVSLLPYLVDRLIVHRVGGFVSTFVFPCAVTTLEYVNSHGPFGSWGSIAYTQHGNLPLIQMVSVTGLWGLTFLMSWSASVVNWAWEQDFDWRRVRVGVGGYAGILVFILLSGGARLAFFPPESDTVRVASLTKSQIFTGAAISGKDSQTLRTEFQANNADLLAGCEREARAGAKIIFWAEVNAIVMKENEMELIQRGRELARREGIYLGMAIGSLPPGDKPLFENKVVLIEPSGEVAWEYLKARPVPGEGSVPGDGRIHTTDTPYGRISSVICFDTDFPSHVRQAGKAGVDLLFAPSNDWKEAMTPHMVVASFRAIENGFTLIRPTSHGFAAAVDYHGQILSKMDAFRTRDGAMVSYVPIRGITTIYSQIGDGFAWMCILGLIALLVWAVILHRGTIPQGQSGG